MKDSEVPLPCSSRADTATRQCSAKPTHLDFFTPHYTKPQRVYAAILPNDTVTGGYCQACKMQHTRYTRQRSAISTACKPWL